MKKRKKRQHGIFFYLSPKHMDMFERIRKYYSLPTGKKPTRISIFELVIEEHYKRLFGEYEKVRGEKENLEGKGGKEVEND